jgi:hypothetical protein
MNISIGGDPLPGYTATMQFLQTPAGQIVVADLHKVIVDMINFFHQRHIAPALASSNALNQQAPPAAGFAVASSK